METQDPFFTKLDQAIQATKTEAGTDQEREFRKWTEITVSCPARRERFMPGVCRISESECNYRDCYLRLCWRR